ncbi:MAG: type II secretion system inner membrane protein GspF [Gammaproteobacteria bacterium]|nr:type II secretion system inner membrane protein GspF [Gammaproteobacteria bacterium]
MPAFQFIAMDGQGHEQKGVLEAESPKHARQLLRDKTLLPLKVYATVQKKDPQTRDKPSLFARKASLNNKALALFTRQFATLLAAGLPMEEAIGACAEQTEKAKVKSLLLSVRSKVLEGHALAASLREHSESFSPLYCATVAAGEKSGHLDKVLLRLAEYTEQQWQMRQKLKTALIYPVMIVFVAVGIVGFLLEYVVPKMVGVYVNMHQTLPTMTSVLIAISDFVGAYGFYVLILMVASIITFKRFLKKSVLFRERFHRALLRLPLFGHAIKTADTSRFARTLAILSSSGVSVLDAMNIAGQLILSIPIRKAVDVAVQRVREGGAIHLALKQTTYFSPMSVHMIASGEASGQLEPMLERVAITQEDEVSRLIEVGLALFEPAVILVMGGIVLFIVLAVMLPIFQLNQMAG